MNKSPKTNMTSIRFLSLSKVEASDRCGLEPAPSIKDCEDIREALEGVATPESVDALRTGEHLVRASYRGGQMYLYPGVRFNRCDPCLRGGNGYTFWPSKGDKEQVQLRMNGETYNALVEFTS